MNKQTETLSKPKLPFVVDIPEKSNGYAYVRDADGIEIATCYALGKKRAALIVQAVNEYEALCAVAKEAKALRRHFDSDTECTELLSMLNPHGQLAAALSALAALEAVRKGAQ